MSDLIYRDEAIDAIEFGITYAKAINIETGEVKELFQASNDELRKAADRIKQMPSAQLERKTGRWIKPTGMMPPEHHGHYECSECGGWAMTTWMRHKLVLTNFCPNCGAKMEGVNEQR